MSVTKLFRPVRRDAKLAELVPVPAPFKPLPWETPTLQGVNGHATIGPGHTGEAVTRLPFLPAAPELGIHLVTLGELRCEHNGADTDLPKQKLRFALLVYLGMERSVPREKVAALLWPDVDEERARRRLNQSKYAIGIAFGADLIESRGEELRAADQLTIDARDFGTLADVGAYERAIELYRRPFLDGFYVDGASEFERWVERKRAILARTYAHVARTWINTLIERSDYRNAIDQASRWLEFEEHSEDGHRLFMLAMAHAGRSGDAAAHYALWERRLREEEGSQPSESLRTLAAEIRAGAVGPELSKPGPSYLPSRVPVDLPANADQRPIQRPHPSWIAPARILQSFTVAAIVVLLFLITRSRVNPFGDRFYSDTSLDTTRYAVFPFVYDPSVKQHLHEPQLMYDALTYWKGIAVADQVQVGEALSRRGKGPMHWRDARTLARQLGAGRFFLGEVNEISSAFRVRISLYGAGRFGRELRSAAGRFKSVEQADSVFGHLTNELLFGRDTVLTRGEVVGTRSASARFQFAAGLEAVQSWDLGRADASFLAALRHDSQFAQAALWLALVRFWTRPDPAHWAFAADRAAAGAGALSSRDRTLVAALRASVTGDQATACGLYGQQARLDEFDFPTWYSYGHCLVTDDRVVPSSTTSSGWAFQSGYSTGVNAIVRAFRLLPSAHRGMSDDLFVRLRRLLKTSGREHRAGQDGTGSRTFAALPSWSNDSLSFVPYPAAAVFAGRPEAVPATFHQAVAAQRQTFLTVARGWVATYPRSSQALLALAVGLDMAGDGAAVDTLETALRLATPGSERTYVSAISVIIGVKHALPGNPKSLQRAVELADSLLQIFPRVSNVHPDLMAAVAGLRGQSETAAQYHALTNPLTSVPAQIASIGQRAVIYSALAVHPDSVAEFVADLQRQIPNIPDAIARQDAYETWLVRTAVLAFEQLSARLQTADIQSSFYLWSAQGKFSQGDTAGTLALLDSIHRVRGSRADLSLDILLPEASLLAAAGDTARATQLLDSRLQNLSGAAPEELQDPVMAAALGRLILLRCHLAVARGDVSTARRWSSSLLVLWQRGSALRPSEKQLLTSWANGSAPKR